MNITWIAPARPHSKSRRRYVFIGLLFLIVTWAAAFSAENTVLRTPDDRFAELPGFGFEPHYFSVHSEKFGPLRMHFIDEGSADAPVVLLLHGQGSWSYLYRNMTPQLVAAGYRVVAPDYIGFGRSDKLPAEADYSFDAHVEWLAEFIAGMDFGEVTVLMFDWGGFFGLARCRRTSGIRRPDRCCRTPKCRSVTSATWTGFTNGGTGCAACRNSPRDRWSATASRYPYPR